MRFATLAVSVGTFIGGLAVGVYVQPYTAQLLLDLGVNPTRDAQQTSAWLKTRVAALDHEKQCKDDAQLVVNHAQLEYDRWSDNVDFCMNKPSNERWEDPMIGKTECKQVTDAFDKRKARLAIAKGAMRACTTPAKS